MKLLKRRRKVKVLSNYGGTNISQYTGSKVFLNKINTKKRGFKKPRKIYRHYSKFVKRVLFFSAFFVVSFLLFNILKDTKYFYINDLQITGSQTFVNSGDVRTIVEQNISDQTYFSLNTAKIRDILFHNFFGAKNFVVEKKFPNKLFVVVEERIPLAILYNSQTGESMLVDEEGFILGYVVEDFKNLPKVMFSQELLVGQTISEDILPISMQIIEYAEKYKIQINDIKYDDKDFTFIIENRVEVKAGKDKSIEDAFSVIYALITKSEEEGRKIVKIDLRYDKVIVIYDNSV